MGQLAILENGNLKIAPNQLQIGDNTIINPTDEQLLSAGYKEFVPTQPSTPKWYNSIVSYTETDTQILQEWKYEKQPAPDYKQLVVSRIQEKYDFNDEISLLAASKLDPTDADYIAWRNYVQQCKNAANTDIDEYNNA